MEVHPPNRPIESWREFFVHIITITIGLLIALSLEALVEWRHHRALVHEARDNIRREIADNHRQLLDNLQAVREDQKRLTENIKLLKQLRETGHLAESTRLQYSLNWSSFGDSAWATARDTGAFGYMDYDEVQCYAGIYLQQALISQEALNLLREQTRAVAPMLAGGTPESMTAAELETTIGRTGDRLADLKGLEQIMAQWNSDCAGTGTSP